MERGLGVEGRSQASLFPKFPLMERELCVSLGGNAEDLLTSLGL